MIHAVVKSQYAIADYTFIISQANKIREQRSLVSKLKLRLSLAWLYLGAYSSRR